MSTPTTLYDYYTSLGVTLPSIPERAVLFEDLGLGSAGSYTGTASQNTALLSALVDQSMPTNSQFDQSLATLDPYADDLKSFSVGDILTVLDQATTEQLFSALQSAGVSFGDYSDGLTILQSYPANESLYDVIYSIIQDASGASWGSYSDNSSYEFPVPDQVSWGAPSGGDNFGQIMSPEYSITSQGWSLSQPGDLSGVTEDVLSFVKGPALDSLWAGMSKEASNIIINDIVKPSVSPQLFNLMTNTKSSISDLTSLKGIFQGWLTSTMDQLNQGLDAVSNDGVWDDSSIWDRTHKMETDLEEFVVKKVGASIGSPITQYMRVFFQHSNLQFGIDDSNKSGAFLGEEGHRYAVIGASSGDDLQGASGNDVLIGQGGDDNLSGNGGDDYLAGHDGHDVIDGGAGIDTASFDGIRTDFTLHSQAGTFLVNRGTTVNTSLTNVERLHFTDINVALDFDGATSAGGIYRLYQATFDRTPDLNGLGYWIKQADNGEGSIRMAEDFTWSQEFQQLYGVTTYDNYQTGANINALVTGFYQHVLHRTPDQGGLDFYSNAISTHQQTVGQVLADISNSPENYVATIGQIQNGIEYTPWAG